MKDFIRGNLWFSLCGLNCGLCPMKLDEYDIFITHRNWKQDFEKMKEMGVEAYNYGQMQKLEILKLLLKGYNDGRRKSFFCLAVNLLDLEDLKTVVEQLAEEKKVGKPYVERKIGLCGKTVPVISRAAGCGAEME